MYEKKKENWLESENEEEKKYSSDGLQLDPTTHSCSVAEHSVSVPMVLLHFL